eukprot:1938102-Amphidinium_carterae.1
MFRACPKHGHQPSATPRLGHQAWLPALTVMREDARPNGGQRPTRFALLLTDGRQTTLQLLVDSFVYLGASFNN